MKRVGSVWSVTLLVMASICAPGTAAAQRATFTPVITLGVFYTDNVFYVEEPRESGESGESQVSSAGFRVGLGLPLGLTMKRSTLELIYVPLFESFSDFSDLDNLSHRLRLDWDYKPDGRRGLRFSTRYASSADQVDPESLEGTPLFLTRRIRRDGGRADLNYNQRLRSRLQLRMGLGASSWSFEEISGVPQGPLGFEIEDRTDLRASFGLNRAFKRGHRLGFSYGFSRFDLDLSGEQDIHALSLVYGVEILDRTETAFSVGCFWREGEQNGSRCNLQGTLQLDRNIGRLWLNLRATHVPSSGDVGQGTSTNTVASLALGGNELMWWSWGAWARFSRRDPDDPAQPRLDTVSFGAAIGRSFTRVVGFRLTGSYAEQTSETGAQEGSYYRLGLGVVLHPLGRTRLGRGVSL